MKFNKDILLVVLSLVMTSILFVMFISYLDTPILVKSHTSGKCMYWEDKEGKHSCNTLPAEYEIVWGE